MPTAIWKSRLRSGSARQCPLGSGARGGGPAVPPGIWTARRRRRTRRRRMRRRRRRRTALIKSNNPHLAGGEKTVCTRLTAPVSTGNWGSNVDIVCHSGILLCNTSYFPTFCIFLYTSSKTFYNATQMQG